MSAEIIHRLHFAFTVTFHYLFPQLTMGLALLIVVLKTVALRTGSEAWDRAARFWGRIFGINFVFGVVTGIPMEFEFGTNWARFSRLSGGVIGQPLAMEGVFSFFLESAFLGLFLYGEKRISPRMHWFSAVMVWLGSWISGFFIIVTDAWMQHPVGYARLPDGHFEVLSFWQLLLNPVGDLPIHAQHDRRGGHRGVCDERRGRVLSAGGPPRGVRPHLSQSGRDCRRHFVHPHHLSHRRSGRQVCSAQPAGRHCRHGGPLHSQAGAPIVLMGQPNEETGQIDNPIVVNDVLSFLIYGTTKAEVKGLDQFPRDQWPTALPLLFYAYHIMAGLGTWFVLLMVVAAFLLWRGRLYNARWVLWALLLSFPLPYIANTAGWMTAELGRQPWLIYGLMRTSEGFSNTVSASNGLFTLIGFMGLYTLLGLLFTVLVYREIDNGPEPKTPAAETVAAD